MAIPGIGVTITSVDNPQSSGMTIADGYRKILAAALDPDDKHLADAVIYPIQRALVRDWVYSEDLPTEIITALRDAIIGGAE